MKRTLSEQLREAGIPAPFKKQRDNVPTRLLNEAADTIESLQAEVNQLREAFAGAVIQVNKQQAEVEKLEAVKRRARYILQLHQDGNPGGSPITDEEAASASDFLAIAEGRRE